MTSKDGRTAVQKAQDRLSDITTQLTASLWEPAKKSFPAFDNLPQVQGHTLRCLWGFFDKDGKKDEIGTVNLLTPDVVKEASVEIKTGRHVQLDRTLNQPFPGFGRLPLEHRVIENSTGAALDDELHLNTQSSSQWDSLKHYAHQRTRLYYNNLSHEDAVQSITNGIHNWCERGGIVGRGVLVDWVRWYEQTKRERTPLPTTKHEIPISEIEEVLRFQGTSTRVGDILLVRTGYGRWQDEAEDAEVKEVNQRARLRSIGLKANEETVRWLYDRHFAAVAGDQPGFEAWPPPWTSGWVLHEWLLVGFGTPIGELWDLETLSKMCDDEHRWTFFLTSAPLYVKGGIGSPPGTIAIF